MRKIFRRDIFFIILISLLIITSILFVLGSYTNNNTLHNEILGGKHELRKLSIESSSVYFLLIKNYSSVRFYFLNHNGEYQLMETELKNVKIKIDNTVVIPYVKFYWTNDNFRVREEVSKIYKYDITSVVIYCRDLDFQPNINDLQ